MFFVYIIQNRLNNKIYVGKSSNPTRRFEEHKKIAKGSKPKEFSIIHSAIHKYGEPNFLFFTIEEYQIEQDAYDAEEFWISFLRTDITRFGKDCGYNANGGGMGARSGPENHMFGKHHTDETKALMSSQRKGELNANFGKHFSDATKIIMANKKAGLYLGQNNPRAILTDNQAKEIREKRKNGLYTIKQLADMYYVSKRTIEKVIYNITFRNVK